MGEILIAILVRGIYLEHVRVDGLMGRLVRRCSSEDARLATIFSTSIYIVAAQSQTYPLNRSATMIFNSFLEPF